MNNYLKELKVFRLPYIKFSVKHKTNPYLWEIKSRFIRLIIKLFYALINLPKYIHCLTPGSLYIPYIDIPLTTKCTLHCKDCNALIPQYSTCSRTWDVNINNVTAHISKLLDAVDGIGVLVLIGGEPFLYPELCKLINAVKTSKKIGIIRVVTNGTIVPDDATCSCLRNPKTYVSISDYGKISSKMTELVDTLKKAEVPFAVYPILGGGWVDYGGIFCRRRDSKELRNYFLNCMARCKTMIDGKIYQCSRAARLNDLRLKEEECDDFVTLVDDKEIARNNIHKFLMMDYTPSCDYCDFPIGRKIKAAVQLNEPPR